MRLLIQHLDDITEEQGKYKNASSEEKDMRVYEE